MAPIMVELNNRDSGYIFIWTGQHKETINEILEKFKIKKPDFYLYLGKEIKSPFKGLLWLLWVSVKAALVALFSRDKGIVLIHGDASSALIGLIYGKFKGCKIGHVEAGHRSFNYLRPFPEEIIRVMIGRFADYHFAAGPWVVKNLKKVKGIVIDTGFNTLYDSLMIATRESGNRNRKIDGEYAIVNVHRFENIQNKTVLKKIVTVVSKISKDFKIIFVLHPPTEYQLKKFNLYEGLKSKHIELIPRQDYMTYMGMLIDSEFIMTDSGGNQQETSYLGHPCLILRKETEGREGLGRNVVISGLSEKKVMDFVKNYKKYQKGPLKIEKSPTKIIVDFITQIQSGDGY